MATRPEDLQNWSLWDFDENPVFKFQTGNPTYGYGGGTVLVSKWSKMIRLLL